MSEPFANVRLVRDGREPLIYLRVSGFATLEEAKQGIVKSLNEDGIDGEGGEVKNIDIKEGSIGIETDICGFWIDDASIKQAMALKGREISC